MECSSLYASVLTVDGNVTDHQLENRVFHLKMKHPARGV
jgi:hypothetical protein